MPHNTELVATVAGGLGVAFIFGAVAWRLRLPLIVGYLAAGIAIGPFTPGYVADGAIAAQLAEIGVILLMFGVGVHFSVRDLWAARRISLPGAIGQVLVAIVLGVLLSLTWGWTLGEGIVLGLALSVASTVVLLRALESTDGVSSEPGRVAVGWLVVEDLVCVVAVVLLPALAGPLGASNAEPFSIPSLATDLGVTIAAVIAFAAFMLVVGGRVVPALLERVEATGSRELFVLAVLAVALGVAVLSSETFGFSYALGAFLAGVVVNGSALSHRAAEQALPLRDAFSVLFFVSVGMLIDPVTLWESADRLVGVLAIVLVGKAAAAAVLVWLLGGPIRVGLVVAAGLSQVGEFSFILAEAGHALDLLPDAGRDLVLGAALVSITLNPLLFAIAGRVAERVAARAPAATTPAPSP